MKLSYFWLSELVKIDDIDPEELAYKLTMSTAEIEGLEEVGGDLKGVVVGKILEVRKHPNSDYLLLTRVDVGNDILNVISGAPNTRENTFVPVALVGSKLPDGTLVKKTRLRGVESSGIVCSERELGVSDDHSGLWILNREGILQGLLKPGTPVTDIFPTRDYVIEIDNKSINNRPDLWGHYGFAREISSIFDRKLKPAYSQEEIDYIMKSEGKDEIAVSIEDEKLCPRYTAIMLGGVKIGKSPYKLRRRLYTLGVRPINSIVDITNYVMLEIGQPLHAFDASEIAGQRIIVRRAFDDEVLTTLDGFERRLSKDMLIIADQEKAIAIAGVMGGLNSEISDITERIIIESANFNPVSVRRTANALGLRTEASNRFEKGHDPELTFFGVVGAVSMIRRMIPEASLASKIVDVNYSRKEKVAIPLNCEWVSRVAGIPIEKKRIVGILQSLKFGIQENKDGNLMVTVPSFRATKDISIPQDLVEEIGRIYGYDNIPPVLPRIECTPPPADDTASFIRCLKTLISEELSFTEVYTYSFQDDSILDLFYPGGAQFVRLKNPVSSSLSRLRRSLIPGLYSLIEKNLNYRDEFSIFEIGSVYNPNISDSEINNILPRERQMVGALVLSRMKEFPIFFRVKGKLETLFLRLNLKGGEFISYKSPCPYKRCFNLESAGDMTLFHPGRWAFLVLRDTCFGFIAELNPNLLRRIGIDFDAYRAAVFEMDVELLKELVMEIKVKYEKLPKYPEVVLALAVVVSEDVPVREVRNFISSFKSKLIERVELFDIYRGKSLPEGKKNLAFNVYYRREDRTLEEKEANEVHEEIAKKIRDHGWELR